MGIAVGFADISCGLFIPAKAMQEKEPNSPPVILLPQSAEEEQQTWVLAHELGHASLGHRVGQKPRIVMEIEAWHWAKRLGLPEASETRGNLAPSSLSMNRNAIEAQHCDLVNLGRELGVLKAWEVLEKE